MNRVKAGALEVWKGGTRAARALPCLMVSVMAATLSAQSPRFVPGEVIAKFVPGSEASTVVARVAERQPLDLTALNPVAERLGEGVGVPLRPSGLNSGHFCVLSVDADQLKEQLARKLRARAHVEGVEVVPDTAAITLSVAFSAGSEEARMRPARLVALLERELGLPLKGEVLRNGRLTLRVNLDALTLSLVERLKALPDVESVQPNFLLKGFMR